MARGSQRLGLLLVALLASPAAAEPPVAPEDVRDPVAWGAARNVTRHENLWFAGQPDQAGLEAAREAGVSVVVNLRHPSELDWDEEAAARELGLRYYNVPVVGSAPLSQETFDAIDARVAEHPGEQVLVHCASSNRVGAWFATHLVTRAGMRPDDALEVARRAGLTNEALEAKVRAHLAALVSERGE